MNKINKGLGNNPFNRNSKNKIKHKGANRLNFKDTNTVNFDTEEIEKLFKEYKNTIATYKMINSNTIEITSKLLKNTWFFYNLGNYIEIKHLNSGNEGIKVHSQFETYTLKEAFRTVALHDSYKSFQLNYRNTDMGRMFNLIENGETKYVKIS